jgi:hypothetical protein
MDEKADINLDKSSYQNMKLFMSNRAFYDRNEQWPRNDGEMSIVPPKLRALFGQF